MLDAFLQSSVGPDYVVVLKIVNYNTKITGRSILAVPTKTFG